MTTPIHPAGRITALDGIRGIAVGLILFVHLFAGSLDPIRHHQLRSILEVSTHGVDLFFVLSGFLIGGILLDNRGSPRALRVFYLRRFLRIVPLYAVLLVVSLGFVLRLPEYAAPWWVYATFHSNLRNLLDPVTHWPPLAVTWSLAVEEQFYLLAPCLIHFTPWRKLPHVLLGIIAGAYCLRWGLLLSGLPEARHFIHFLLPTRADNLATGLLLAWALRAPEARPVLTWLATHWGALLAAAVTGIIAYALWDTSYGQLPAVALGYVAVNLAAGLVILGAATSRPGWLLRILETRPLVSFGKYAYFLYLWHALVAFLYFHFARQGDGVLLHSPVDLIHPVLITLITWLLAALSWRLFESPLIRLGQRFHF